MVMISVAEFPETVKWFILTAYTDETIMEATGLRSQLVSMTGFINLVIALAHPYALHLACRSPMSKALMNVW